MPQLSPASLDWYRASYLHERLAVRRITPPLLPPEYRDDVLGKRRLERWRAEAPFTTDEWWSQRMALEHASEEEWLTALGESSHAMSQALRDLPAWVTPLVQAFTCPPAMSATLPPSETWSKNPAVRFLEAFSPLIQQARSCLSTRLHKLLQEQSDAPCDAATLAALLYENLPGQLLQIVLRTMVLELNVARVQELLQGDTVEERFQSFINRMAQPAHGMALLQEYPVLGRLVVESLDRWVTVSVEFVQRLCDDWLAIQQTFAPPEDPGPLVRVESGMGDTHRGGRSVIIATFRSGFRLVYKPKSLAIDRHFQQLLVWLNMRGAQPPLRPLTVLERGQYGWVEYITAASCTSPDAVQRFYERQGSYLALFYVLEATDLHQENIIAAGEHPYPIDLEALFHPHMRDGAPTPLNRSLDQALAQSVLRIGLLPQRLWAGEHSEGIDISGLGGEPGQRGPGEVLRVAQSGTDTMHLQRQTIEMPESQNRPKLCDGAVDVVAYQAALLTGFTRMYRLLLAYRDELLSDHSPIALCTQDEVRVLLRPTRTYGVVYRESCHPDVLRDALDRDCLLDRLWAEIPYRPYLQHVVRAECQALRAGDIPMFTTTPTSHDLWSDHHHNICGVLAETGMELVRRRLEHLCEDDLAKQLWFIRASLATLPKITHHVAHAAPRVSAQPAAVTREELLAQAMAIADHLDRTALRDAGEVAWLGITLVREQYWSLTPLGADLYDGLPGIVLFLAYLGELTRAERYKLLAQTTWSTLQRSLAQDPATLTTIGGYSGWGGVIYALTHVAVLWEQPALLAEAEQMVERIAELIDRDDLLDVIAGSAGCIGSLLNLYQWRPAKRILEVAVQCGDRLLATAQTMAAGIGWKTARLPQPLTGFAHGAAGMAWALLRLATATGLGRFETAARAAMAYERHLFVPAQGNWPDLREPKASTPTATADGQTFMTAWCHGAPGIGLGRLTLLPCLEEREMYQDIAVAIETTRAHGFGANHSLCHGALGNLDLLVEAHVRLGRADLQPHINAVAAAIVADMRQNGWRCGNPLGVESPGLMTGLAGIGYELLRLAEPARVPSVLALAPPSGAGAEKRPAP
jgi:type 2 lantibiotic biosynthesis protein LanM